MQLVVPFTPSTFRKSAGQLVAMREGRGLAYGVVLNEPQNQSETAFVAVLSDEKPFISTMHQDNDCLAIPGEWVFEMVPPDEATGDCWDTDTAHRPGGIAQMGEKLIMALSSEQDERSSRVYYVDLSGWVTCDGPRKIAFVFRRWRIWTSAELFAQRFNGATALINFAQTVVT